MTEVKVRRRRISPVFDAKRTFILKRSFELGYELTFRDKLDKIFFKNFQLFLDG
jgi:hypothetical protein